MSSYYCLVAGLPDVNLDDGKLNYTVENFKSELYPELSRKDQLLIDLFYLKYDNADLLRLLKDKDAVVDGGGNFSSEELLALITAVREGETPDSRYPLYMYQFIEQYLTLQPENSIVPMICWPLCIMRMQCNVEILLLLPGLNLI